MLQPGHPASPQTSAAAQVFEKALSATEMMTLYTDGPESALTALSSSLKTYFKVDQVEGCTTGVFRDYSGESNHAVLHNDAVCVTA